MEENVENYRNRSKLILEGLQLKIGEIGKEIYSFNPIEHSNNLLKLLNISSREKAIYSDYLCEIVDFTIREHKNAIGKVSSHMKENGLMVGTIVNLSFCCAGAGIGRLIDKNSGSIIGTMGGLIAFSFFSRAFSNIYADMLYTRYTDVKGYYKGLDEIRTKTLKRLEDGMQR